MEVGESPTHIVSDHLAFVNEVLEWDGKHRKPTSVHAAVWRRLQAQIRSPEMRPTAEWIRAHQSLEDCLLETGSAYKFVGNFWADIFSKMGSASIAVSDVLTMASGIKLRDVRDGMKYTA